MPIDLPHLDETEITLRLASALQSTAGSPYPEFPHMSLLHDSPPVPAAVLIPLLKKDERWHLLFTRRNNNLPEHSGQVAFPGGRSDPEDCDLVSTALRESFEEIGLAPQDVRVLGWLHEFVTITNYLVTPVVGVIPWPYNFKLAEEEVSRVFTIPLEWLSDPAHYEVQQRHLPDPFKPVSVIYYKAFDGEILWGASARFTLTLLDALLKE